MTKLSPDARDLLAEARSGESPAPGARARVRARVLARVGAGAAAGTAAALIAADAKAAAGAAGAAGSTVKAVATTSVLLKWVAVVGVAGTMALGAGIARDRMGGQAAVSSATPAGDARPAPGPNTTQTAAPSAEAVAPAPTAPPVAPAPPAPPVIATVAPATTPHHGASSAAAPAAAPAESELEAEASRLARAQAEIRAGRPAGALEVLDAPVHDGGTPHTPGTGAKDGVLGEERVAARILALCALGRKDEARAEARRFLSAYPRSPAAERVRTSCAAEPSP